MNFRVGVFVYLLVTVGVFSGCAGPQAEVAPIPTPASLDGRTFRQRLSGSNYRPGNTGYESADAFELKAQVNPPAADRNDITMVARDKDSTAFLVRLVVRSTLVDDGGFRLKPEAVFVAPPSRALGPLEYGELSKDFLKQLARRKLAPMPVLSDGSRILRAKQVLIRDSKGGEREFSYLLENGSAGGGAVALIPVLKNDDVLQKRASDEKVVIAFETLSMDSGRNASPVRPWLDGKRPSEANTLTHPGDNAHLKETIDRAMTAYRKNFATQTISTLDFVERFRLADCKMVALATVQKTSRIAGADGFRGFVVSGNRAEGIDRVDLLTSNHAWNAGIDRRVAETLVFADFTPESRRAVEYGYDSSTMDWVLGRVRLATTRDEFTAVANGEPTGAAKVPRRLTEGTTSLDAEFKRLAMRRIEALLPSPQWDWEAPTSLTFFPDMRAELVRKNRSTGERVTISVEPIMHFGLRGEGLYGQDNGAGIWGLSTTGIPDGNGVSMNWTGKSTLEEFDAEVTSVNKSSSSHSKDHYWRVEMLFTATR